MHRNSITVSTKQERIAGLAKQSPQMAFTSLAYLMDIDWLKESDLRALKQTLQMDILRGQTPEMVRKEVWAHRLAYNLIRGQMAAAAQDKSLLPLPLSFTGAVQAVHAFAGWLWTAGADESVAVCQRLRAVLASYQLEERPHRSEPRARNRRPKKDAFLNQPRRKKGNPVGRKDLWLSPCHSCPSTFLVRGSSAGAAAKWSATARVARNLSRPSHTSRSCQAAWTACS
jgi:hypothetical protein